MSAVFAWALDAEAKLPNGSCAIVVAARQTLIEVDQFLQDNEHIPISGVYRSNNGWFVIASSVLPKNESEQAIATLVARRLVPSDSYCSSGGSFVAAVLKYTRPSNQRDSESSLSLDFHGPFDARTMTVEEKRLLQASLSLSGHYKGLIDGAWGRGSQESLDSFAQENFGSDASNGHAAASLLFVIEELTDGDWQPFEFPQSKAFFLGPKARLEAKEVNGSFVHLVDAESEITVLLNILPSDKMTDVHGDTVRNATSEPYVVRNDGFWVTAASIAGGRIYVRSRYDPNSGSWATAFTSSATKATGSNLIIASLSDSPVPNLDYPDGGYVDQQISRLLEEFKKENTASDKRQTTRGSAEPETGESSGTGFYINQASDVLTNAHVVEGCSDVTVNGRPARVIAANETFDLAVVDVISPTGKEEWLTFESEQVKLNSDVTVAGFPLLGLLGGLNVTRGSVSSLKGLGGDALTLQISAPVQPGNSGGPMVNAEGAVVGVVVAKLDSIAVASAVGDIPQNVNFAIRGEIAKTFLSANSIGYSVISDRPELSPESLAELLSRATVVIECR
ncbi:MAG: serine protease [Paracoccaceae bacterium]|nr:serine protease [Paracoccaceae bacterium]